MGRVGTGLTIGGLAIALGLGGLYVGRRAVAEEVLVGWLHRRGIAADVQVQRLEWDGFTGRIIVGDPADPDVRVERVDVDYLIGLPWSRDGLGLTPKRVVLERPVIKAEWTGEALSFGSLDPLIKEFTSRPPGKSPGPIVIVNGGKGIVTTPYGPLSLTADARLNDSRLEWLKASLDPAVLTLDGKRAEGVALEVEARSTADALTFKGRALAEKVTGTGFNASGFASDLEGLVPYPAKNVRAAKGPVRLLANANIGQVDSEALKGKDVAAQLQWNGLLEGWIDRFVLDGRAQLATTATQLASGNQSARNLDVQGHDLVVSLSRGQAPEEGGRIQWSLAGPVDVTASHVLTGGVAGDNVRINARALSLKGLNGQFEASGPLNLAVARMQTSDLHLQQVSGVIALDATRGIATRIRLDGRLKAQGRYGGLGPLTASDAPELAHLKQAAQSFALDVPDARLTITNRTTALELDAPARLSASNGAVVTLAQLSGPVMRLDGGAPVGAARLVMAGEGMPQIDVNIPRWQAVNGGLTARLDGKAALDFTPVSGIALQTKGTLTASGGTTRFTPDGCSDISARQVDMGENRLDNLQGQLCPNGGPVFVMAGGAWELGGQLRNTRLSADFLNADLTDGSGNLKVQSRGGQLGVALSGIVARLSDTTPTPTGAEAGSQLRFNPVQATGQVRLQSGRWTGHLDLAREGIRLAGLDLSHDGSTGMGQLGVASERLDFSPSGLQPASISPMLASYMTNVQGRGLTLNGQIGWTRAGVQSGGVLNLSGDDEGLTFDTPAGRLQGLTGTLTLTDLLNPTSAGLQTVRARRLDAVVPMENLAVNVDLGDRKLRIVDAAFQLNDGRVSAPEIIVPLDGSRTVHGRLELDNVQLNDLLAAANLGDKAIFDAKVTGGFAFDYGERLGWQIRDGRLSASSGRLQIQREVLTGMSAEGNEVVAEGGVEVPVQPNAVQDLAYQALENLAIEDLSANVFTLPEGRLAINFVIDGHYDPPQRKELRLSIMDLLRGNFMQRKLDLPSRAPVILRLNTSWNANELATEIYNVMQKRFDRVETSSSATDSSSQQR